MSQRQKEERLEDLLDKAASIVEDHSGLTFKQAQKKLQGLPVKLLEHILKWGDGHTPTPMVMNEELP